MNCKKCGGNNLNISSEQVGSKTGTKGAGCLWGIGRFMLIGCTFGLWLLVGRRRATSHTQFNHITVGICQDCGNRQKV